jgi:hypothetical protein
MLAAVPGPSISYSHQAGSADLARFYGKPDKSETYHIVFSNKMPRERERPSIYCLECRLRRLRLAFPWEGLPLTCAMPTADTMECSHVGE